MGHHAVVNKMNASIFSTVKWRVHASDIYKLCYVRYLFRVVKQHQTFDDFHFTCQQCHHPCLMLCTMTTGPAPLDLKKLSCFPRLKWPQILDAAVDRLSMYQRLAQISCAGTIFILTSVWSLLQATPLALPHLTSRDLPSQWAGWHETHYLFVLWAANCYPRPYCTYTTPSFFCIDVCQMISGDSYTSTDFQHTAAQPYQGNLFGNPENAWVGSTRRVFIHYPRVTTDSLPKFQDGSWVRRSARLITITYFSWHLVVLYSRPVWMYTLSRPSLHSLTAHVIMQQFLDNHL